MWLIWAVVYIFMAIIVGIVMVAIIRGIFSSSKEEKEEILKRRAEIEEEIKELEERLDFEIHNVAMKMKELDKLEKGDSYVDVEQLENEKAVRKAGIISIVVLTLLLLCGVAYGVFKYKESTNQKKYLELKAMELQQIEEAKQKQIENDYYEQTLKRLEEEKRLQEEALRLKQEELRLKEEALKVKEQEMKLKNEEEAKAIENKEISKNTQNATKTKVQNTVTKEPKRMTRNGACVYWHPGEEREQMVMYKGKSVYVDKRGCIIK